MFSAIDVWEGMLMGFYYATPIALKRAWMELEDLTLIEMHASKKLGRNRVIGEIDISKFNVLGGSLAYGHRVSVNGTRLMTQVCNDLKRCVWRYRTNNLVCCWWFRCGNDS